MTVIPFNKPHLAGNELSYITEAVFALKTSGDGAFTKKCHAHMEQRFGARKVLLTTSCTTALEMAAILCDIGPEDEIVLPSYTFVSTANAFFLRGGRPRFVDIRPDTLNIDESKIEAAVTPRTKAIVPVHYAGVGAEMDAIGAIAARHGIAVVEDAAQGVNARYKGRFLGTIGDLGAYSFHETKNFICGEGGALCINGPRFVERAEIIREKGTDRSKFLRGEVDKYTWIDIGSSYLPSDMLAAFLFAQLERMDELSESRKRIFMAYHELLSPLAERGLVSLPPLARFDESNYHLFYILAGDTATRDRLMAHCKSNGVHAIFHYVPLHTSPVGRSLGYGPGDLPVTESIAGRLLRLPFYYDLTPDDQVRVATTIEDFFKV